MSTRQNIRPSQIVVVAMISLLGCSEPGSTGDDQLFDLQLTSWETDQTNDTYLNCSWPTLHGGPFNADYSATDPSPRLSRAVHLLPGVINFTAQVIDDQRGLAYLTSGTPDRPHLYALRYNATDGDTVAWTSADWPGDPKLGAVSMASSPIIDHDGHVYIADSNYLWSATSAGELRWRAPLPIVDGLKSTFITSIFTPSGLVGGVTTAGRVALYDRKTGKERASLQLPGMVSDEAEPTTGSTGVEALMERCLWRDENDILMVEQEMMVKMAVVGFSGNGVPVGNTPAVVPDPYDVMGERARIYVPAVLEAHNLKGEHHVKLFRVDVFHDLASDSVSLTINERFHGLMQGGQVSATSPTISPDGRTVFLGDGFGTLYAFDAQTGGVDWKVDVGTMYGSVSAPQSGAPEVYVGGTYSLKAVSRVTHALAWERDYAELARQRLAPLPGFTRVAMIAGVSVSSPNRITVPMTLGYKVPGIELGLWPMVSLLVVLDRAGEVVGKPVPLADVSETLAAPSVSGAVHLTYASVSSSMAHCIWRNNIAGLGDLLPEPIKPVGGIGIVRPE